MGSGDRRLTVTRGAARSGAPLPFFEGPIDMNMQQLLKMGQQMQSQMSEIQENLDREEITASSGGGMVTATVDGKGGIKAVTIDPAVVDSQDVEMLEDLVLAAVSEAQSKAKAVYEEQMKQMTGGLPFPMKLPGLF
jgi:nucleoid-associated protein EbfC